jgi:hypothetical protein
MTAPLDMKALAKECGIELAKTKAAEIRPNLGAAMERGRCENTDEVVGNGDLHVEQMSDNCYWARLDLPDGRGIVMWFNSKSPIKLIAEFD